MQFDRSLFGFIELTAVEEKKWKKVVKKATS